LRSGYALETPWVQSLSGSVLGGEGAIGYQFER
jgi:hypothetical protein